MVTTLSKLDELIAELCPNGVEYKKIKQVYKRLKGTPITAGKMKEIDNPNGEIRIFAGGKTVINSMEKDIPNANITRVPAVLVQSRGVIDAVYYDKPFTFKNEMWAYTADNEIAVKYLYYVLKSNLSHFRKSCVRYGFIAADFSSGYRRICYPRSPSTCAAGNCPYSGQFHRANRAYSRAYSKKKAV